MCHRFNHHPPMNLYKSSGHKIGWKDGGNGENRVLAISLSFSIQMESCDGACGGKKHVGGRAEARVRK